MERLTPKIDDALDAVMELLKIEPDSTSELQTLKVSILNKLREYGVQLVENEWL